MGLQTRVRPGTAGAAIAAALNKVILRNLNYLSQNNSPMMQIIVTMTAINFILNFSDMKETSRTGMNRCSADVLYL